MKLLLGLFLSFITVLGFSQNADSAKIEDSIPFPMELTQSALVFKNKDCLSGLLTQQLDTFKFQRAPEKLNNNAFWEKIKIIINSQFPLVCEIEKLENTNLFVKTNLFGIISIPYHYVTRIHCLNPSN